MAPIWGPSCQGRFGRHLVMRRDCPGGGQAVPNADRPPGALGYSWPASKLASGVTRSPSTAAMGGCGLRTVGRGCWPTGAAGGVQGGTPSGGPSRNGPQKERIQDKDYLDMYGKHRDIENCEMVATEGLRSDLGLARINKLAF